MSTQGSSERVGKSMNITDQKCHRPRYTIDELDYESPPFTVINLNSPSPDRLERGGQLVRDEDEDESYSWKRRTTLIFLILLLVSLGVGAYFLSRQWICQPQGCTPYADTQVIIMQNLVALDENYIRNEILLHFNTTAYIEPENGKADLLHPKCRMWPM